MFIYSSVFEFEEDSVLNGSTPPADPVEIGQTPDGAAAEIPGPSYTLNGQSVHPVQPLSANLPVRPKREPLKEFELDRVEYFNRQLCVSSRPFETVLNQVRLSSLSSSQCRRPSTLAPLGVVVQGQEHADVGHLRPDTKQPHQLPHDRRPQFVVVFCFPCSM